MRCSKKVTWVSAFLVTSFSSIPVDNDTVMTGGSLKIPDADPDQWTFHNWGTIQPNFLGLKSLYLALKHIDCTPIACLPFEISFIGKSITRQPLQASCRRCSAIRLTMRWAEISGLSPVNPVWESDMPVQCNASAITKLTLPASIG